jgi:hypothetical protein
MEFAFVIVPLTVAFRVDHPLAWLGFPFSGVAWGVILAMEIFANSKETDTVPSRR